MKSKPRGKTTLVCEVINVSPFGIWLLFRDREYFLDHKRFPWFRSAVVEDVLEVQVLTPEHLFWPKLDIDLHLEAIEEPEKYPLVSKRWHNKRLNLTPRARRKSA